MYVQNLHRPTKLLSLLLVLGITTHAVALKDDATKPVRINADAVVFNKTKGRAVYSGNVVIVQGTLKMTASSLEISAPNNDIQSIIAKGGPVQFQQRMDDGKFAKGKANRLRYLVKDRKIYMDGRAELTQDQDRFKSEHIEYSTRTGELKAGNTNTAAGKNKGNNKSRGRVSAVFYPTAAKKKK